jgi:hypothetical protein
MAGYAEAEGLLSTWMSNEPELDADVRWAIEKARQSLNDCLEMGLDGEGD